MKINLSKGYCSDCLVFSFEEPKEGEEKAEKHLSSLASSVRISFPSGKEIWVCDHHFIWSKHNRAVWAALQTALDDQDSITLEGEAEILPFRGGKGGRPSAGKVITL